MTARIERGLLIRSEPLERILSGRKTWEMRSRSTKNRGPLVLIEGGTYNALGVVTLVQCLGPLSRDQMVANVDRHAIEVERLDLADVSKYKYALVLENVKRLARPVRVPRKEGQVTFVSIPPETAAVIEALL